MPHFVIECSEQLLNHVQAEVLMQAVYTTAEATGLFKPGDIKVRIKPYKHYIVGSGKDFIHVFGNIMEGRNSREKELLSHHIVRALATLLPEVALISMNIRDFKKTGYCNKFML